MLWQLLILYLLTVQLVISVADNKCMECASTNLQGRWALTGFAQTFRAQSFTANCLPGTDTEHFTTCSGYCMTYLFEDPDTIGSSTVGLMVVRGCQYRLLGMQSSSSNAQTQSASYCEYDKDLARLNSEGNTVYIKALVDFCTGDTCNSKVKDFSVTCKGSAQVGSDAERQCYRCDTMDKNCNYNEEQCNKKFCFKSTVKLHDVYAVHKSCADVNLFGTESGCTSSSLTLFPGNLAKLDGDMTHCYCNDRDYCNGAGSVTPAVLLAILALLKLIF